MDESEGVARPLQLAIELLDAQLERALTVPPLVRVQVRRPPLL